MPSVSGPAIRRRRGICCGDGASAHRAHQCRRANRSLRSRRRGTAGPATRIGLMTTDPWTRNMEEHTTLSLEARRHGHSQVIPPPAHAEESHPRGAVARAEMLVLISVRRSSGGGVWSPFNLAMRETRYQTAGDSLADTYKQEHCVAPPRPANRSTKHTTRTSEGCHHAEAPKTSYPRPLSSVCLARIVFRRHAHHVALPMGNRRRPLCGHVSPARLPRSPLPRRGRFKSWITVRSAALYN